VNRPLHDTTHTGVDMVLFHAPSAMRLLRDIAQAPDLCEHCGRNAAQRDSDYCGDCSSYLYNRRIGHFERQED
jgi:hypothetical protein